MKLKAIALSFLALSTAFCFGQTQLTNVLSGNVGDYRMLPQNRVGVTMTLLWPNPRTFNGWFIRQDPISTTSNTNGYFAFTNVQWGAYRVDVQGIRGTSYPAFVGTNTVGNWPLASLCTNLNQLPPNPATNYLTAAQVYALLSALSGTGFTGTVTNLASSALTVFTNQTVITNNGWTITLAAPASWYFEAIYFENSNLTATAGGNVFGGSNSLVTLNLTTNEVRDGWINLMYQAGASQMNIDVPFVGVGLTGSANYSTAVPWVNYTQVNAAIAGGTFYLTCTASNSVSYATNLVTRYNLTTYSNGLVITNQYQ